MTEIFIHSFVLIQAAMPIKQQTKAMLFRIDSVKKCRPKKFKNAEKLENADKSI